MYPILRLTKEMWRQRLAPQLGLLDVHLSYHRCWPWDIDPWMELNNGRTLTLYDLGRIPMLTRIGLEKVVTAAGHTMTVAGACVRYRRRIRPFERVEMKTKMIGWDHRFLYLDQTLWKQNDCANQILVRIAVTNRKKGGIIPPIEMIERVAGVQPGIHSPALPAWVQKWIETEAMRPWPPA